jgi:hypothetical protein
MQINIFLTGLVARIITLSPHMLHHGSSFANEGLLAQFWYKKIDLTKMCIGLHFDV